MDAASTLPILLGLAWLLPLVSFALIVLFGPMMGKRGRGAGYVATAAIGAGVVCSLIALAVWISAAPDEAATAAAEHAGHAAAPQPREAFAKDWYTLAEFGSLRITIGYYIDALTIAMFVMVTLVATCIHVYSFGYMAEELDDEVTDPLAQTSDGRPLVRRGRYHRFFQYMSLFCFSMLGLVVAGNLAMVFVFWELVGICSYFLIGFYFERRSASNAANKAFIVNRVGDFGMIVGLMVFWAGLGTFAFGDLANEQGQIVERGIFSQVRPRERDHALTVPDGMVKLAAGDEIEAIYSSAPSPQQAEAQIAATLPDWRSRGLGYGLLVLGGLGIFCGCVGKSAQVPLHVWLPDAMEGPTPVSALIHAATMVAAGVYLVGRFYPAFTPEVMLVIAYVGCITLFIAATIALTATDIKRVLAYSTVSQLGYMMFALGVGGWLAGLFHLLTHACFKALLFLCSGSVIHAVHTNEMPEMGGLRKKMPWTAYTMLAGCLAIMGAGVPLVIGLSGYHSKDAILSQALSFKGGNPTHAWMFYVALFGAGLTSFYMFRLWFLTFTGQPRDKHRYEHAHESPRVMTVPLVILAVLAVVVGWPFLGVQGHLEQARPLGTEVGAAEGLLVSGVLIPAEHLAHDVHVPATLAAFVVAMVGFVLATAFYGTRALDPGEVRDRFAPIDRLLRNKWWFDEVYRFLFVRPVLTVAGWVAAVDRKGIDWVVDGLAYVTRAVSSIEDLIDRWFVDGIVNRLAEWFYAAGLWLRNLQTGRLREYVLYIVIATVTLFIIITLYLDFVAAGT